MSAARPFDNPRELLEAWSEQIRGWAEGVPATLVQEMGKEFVQAWGDLSRQAAEHPDQWAGLVARYQRDQMNLWLRMFGGGAADDAAAPGPRPEPGDRRFAAKEWRDNPVFSYLKQSYLLASDMLTDLADRAELAATDKQKLRFYTRQFVDAMSPTNFAATNPEVLREAVETRGRSLLDGLENLTNDLRKGHITITDESAYRLGENIALTPGAVVFENELIQLIQYQPATPTVSNRPLVIVPPFINKFYILDLQPENSFVRWAVEQGNTVFMVSWVNPDSDQGHLRWDDYLESGVFTAFDVARRITRAQKLNAVAWCVGGTLLATALAVLHARGKAPVASATYFTTLLDFSEPGDLGVFIDDVQVAQREHFVRQTGMLPGRDLALIFSMLRANDLIWSYVVNNYLRGRHPAPFDILYWNSDPTNLPASMYVSYIEDMYLQNKLIKPGALSYCGEKVDLGVITTPSYFLSTIDDHIAPWATSFKVMDRLAGPAEFTLGASGHIAGVINPPAKGRRHYWVDGERGGGPEHWLETATRVAGSWWPHWHAWLRRQGGSPKAAPKRLGNARYPVIEPAPGRYVTKRGD